MVKQKHKVSGTNSVKSVAPKPALNSNSNPFDHFEGFLVRNEKILVFFLPLILGLLFAIFTFDVKISEGNDDAMYIEAATKYAADYTGYFYTSNAPLYPMFLGVITIFSGLNLILFKSINVLFFLFQIAITYYAFRRRIPLMVLWPVLIFSSVNSYLLYYSSQTYTEMLFMCLQAFFFLVFFKWYEKFQEVKVITGENQKTSYKVALKAAFAIGGALFLMTLCKNIAIGMLGALIVFLLLQKQYRMMLSAVVGYLIVRFSFEGLKAIIWGAGNQYGSQGAILLQKDAYNAAAGQEDLSGFIARFFQNFDLYVSKRLFQILGFKDPNNLETKTILSVFVLGLLIFTAWRIYIDIRSSSKQKQDSTNSNNLKDSTSGNGKTRPISYPLTALMVLLYISIIMGLTFLVLQVKWDQPRLVMVYVPLLFMVVAYGFYSFLKTKGAGALVAYLAFVILITGSSFITSTKKAASNYPVLLKNLKGDKYYGYTPDWQNYLQLSEWCADSLPPNTLVACRKAPMSFVYGKGKAFFPIYTVVALDSTTNLSNADSALSYLQQNKVTHVILGSLRRNPNKIDGYIINTMHRMMQPIAQKYPQKLKLVKQMGTTEPAYLYELEY